MNSKIPLRQLAERLAEKAGIMPEEAELFIKDFFNRMVIEAIESGEAVTIQGLGTFATCPDVDNPVTFIPAPEFAAEVNEPFAMFRPMEIDESILNEEIEAVRTPEIAQQAEHEPEPVAEPEPQPEPVTEIISADEAIAEAAETEQAEAADGKEADMAEAEAPAFPPILPPELPAEEPAAALPPELSESIPVEEPSMQEVTTQEMPGEETGEAVEEDVSVVPDDMPEEAEAPQPAQVYIPEDEEEFVTYHNQPKSRMGLGFVLGLITGLVVAALALAGYVLFIAEGASKLF